MFTGFQPDLIYRDNRFLGEGKVDTEKQRKTQKELMGEESPTLQ